MQIKIAIQIIVFNLKFNKAIMGNNISLIKWDDCVKDRLEIKIGFSVILLKYDS